MKKFLIFIFLISNSFIRSGDKVNKYFEPFLNAKSESLGNTGMIFGEEYGSFYLAPTSLQKNGIDIQGIFGIQNFFQIFNDYPILKCSFFFKTRIGNFSLGYFGIGSPPNSFPLAYSLEIYNFSLGIGITYNSEGVNFSNEPIVLDNNLRVIMGKRNYLLTNASTMYKSIIGNFSLSLNNFLYRVFDDPLNLISNLSLKPNLRIGYGKEFKIDYIFNKIQVALEIDNLLMNNFYINKEEKDYTLSRKIHLGIEAVKNIQISLPEIEGLNYQGLNYLGNVSISIRVGMKNLFPTFGIGLEFLDTFRLEYAFTNRDLGDSWGKDRKFVNLISFEARVNNTIYEKVYNRKIFN